MLNLQSLFMVVFIMFAWLCSVFLYKLFMKNMPRKLGVFRIICQENLGYLVLTIKGDC